MPETLPATQPGNELEKVVEQPLMALLGKYRSQISEILPKQFDSKRVLKLIVGSINRNPDLLKCTPMSVINSVLTAASIGLEIRPNCAYLLPFKKSLPDGRGGWKQRYECQLVIDYRGKIDLALRSGKVLDIDPDIVYSKDKFRVYRDENGVKRVEHEPILFKTGDNGEHLPIDESDRGVPIGAIAFAAIKDGPPKVCFMPWIDLMKIKDKSKAKSNGPWVTDPLEMCKKTVVHRICKTLPQTPEMAIADQVEAAANEEGVRFDVIDVAPEDEVSSAPLLEESSAAAAQVAERRIAELSGGGAAIDTTVAQTVTDKPDPQGNPGSPTAPRRLTFGGGK